MPPLEFWRGVNPRNAANSRPVAKVFASCTVAKIAEAVMGPIPGMLVNRRAVGSALTCIAICLSIASISSSSASIWRHNEASAPPDTFGNHDLAVLVSFLSEKALERISVLRPLGRNDADLR